MFTFAPIIYSMTGGINQISLDDILETDIDIIKNSLKKWLIKTGYPMVLMASKWQLK